MATLSNTANAAGNAINSTAEKAKSALNSGLANIDENTIDQLAHFKDEAMDRAAAYYEKSEKYVRQNPFYFIGGAVVVGYLAGMLLTRKH